MNTWQMYALASAFFAGLTAILAKKGVAGIPSNAATWVRTVVIILFLSALLSVRREWDNPFALNAKGLFFLICSGLATGLSWVCYFRALQLGPASVVASLDKLSLAFTVLLAAVFLSEHLGWVQWGGVILMTCGALMIAWK